MADAIVIVLNEQQKAKIKKKLGRACNTLEVDRDDLVNMIRYQAPQICIDFNEEQEKIIKQAFPDAECDFAIIDVSDLGTIVKYMAPA